MSTWRAPCRPGALLKIAARNGVSLPASTEAELARLYQFRDFEHFLELWLMTTCALRSEQDFRQVVVDYAMEAASYGAVYLEGIFTPAERVGGGASWDEVFTGFCDGAIEAKEKTGVDVRLTPDIPRNLGPEVAIMTARYAMKYRERGVVGLGLGGPEDSYPGAPFGPAFRLAKDGGLGSVPHAGEVTGAASVREAIDVLQADRLRHGIRSADDPGLLRELAARASCATSVPSPMSVPEQSAHSRSTRCRRCSRPELSAPSTPMTRPCSAPTSHMSTRSPPSSGARQRPRSGLESAERCATKAPDPACRPSLTPRPGQPPPRQAVTGSSPRRLAAPGGLSTHWSGIGAAGFAAPALARRSGLAPAPAG